VNEVSSNYFQLLKSYVLDKEILRPYVRIDVRTAGNA